MPRCPTCGGETQWRGPGLGFAISGISRPHIRYRCKDEHLGIACRGVKRLCCDEDWRLVRPIGKFDALYWELNNVSKNKENLFDLLRDRFNVAGEEKASCPSRHGLPMQRLMGTAAMLIDCFASASARATCPPTSPSPANSKSATRTPSAPSTSRCACAAPTASTSPTAPPPSA